MKLDDVLKFNNMLKNEIDKEMVAIFKSTKQTNIDEELILQDKLISLLLLLRQETRQQPPKQVPK